MYELNQHLLVLVLFGIFTEDKSARLLDLPNNVHNEIVSGIINLFPDLFHDMVPNNLAF